MMERPRRHKAAPLSPSPCATEEVSSPGYVTPQGLLLDICSRLMLGHKAVVLLELTADVEACGLSRGVFPVELAGALLPIAFRLAHLLCALSGVSCNSHDDTVSRCEQSAQGVAQLQPTHRTSLPQAGCGMHDRTEDRRLTF